MNTSRLRRWLALSALALFAATWRLWTPQVVFPQIPFFEVLCSVPGWVDWVALAAMLAGLVGLLLTPGERGASVFRVLSPRAVPWFAGLFTAALTLLVLLDQHRFQPWAYQFAIVAIVLGALAGAACSEKAFSLLRLLTIGIYFWSAVSKLDYTFLHGLGPELLRGTLMAFGLEPGRMQPEVATAMALAFPLDELAVAGLLAFRRTRKYGLVLSIAMHLLLLATLGPWGLNHSWGVLLWNVYFIGQNVLLFAPMASEGRQLDLASRGRQPSGQDSAAPSTSTDMTRRLTPAARLASWVVYAAVVLPVLEPFGLLDHWPGWAVYAPGAERVRWCASWRDVRFLKSFYSNDDPRWGPSFSSPLRTDRWSLDTFSAPISPDARFQVGVALAVAERSRKDDSGGMLAVESRADRLTGERDTTYLTGTQEIRDYADTFWLNTRPRKLGGW